MSKWAEIRALHAKGVPKKEIARRLEVDVKTVRRALEQARHPEKRATPKRGRLLDVVRPQVEAWLREEPKLTAKRIGSLLEERGLLAVPIGERTVREFVAEVREQLRVAQREAFVHRTHRPGETLEVDFGETWAVIGGEKLKLRFFVATLPYSNAYFAKAYRVERIECLLDGLTEAFRFFGGLPRRLVLDNTSLAVKEVLRGRERVEHRRFESWRGELSLHVDFCAPAKGNEKGSVEGGVKYVRNNCFRPLAHADSLEALNVDAAERLVRDLPRRSHPEGGTAADAFARERDCLRPLPAFLPEPCRVVMAVANKHAHVRIDNTVYSLPTEYARRAVTIKLFADRVVLAARDEVVAEHARSFKRGELVLDARHVLDLLERKHRAAREATALQELPAVLFELRDALQGKVRKPDREWVRILQLMKVVSLDRLEAAAAEALRVGSPRLATIQQLLRHGEQGPVVVEPVVLTRPELALVTVAAPDLSAYDVLTQRRGTPKREEVA